MLCQLRVVPRFPRGSWEIFGIWQNTFTVTPRRKGLSPSVKAEPCSSQPRGISTHPVEAEEEEQPLWDWGAPEVGVLLSCSENTHVFHTFNILFCKTKGL